MLEEPSAYAFAREHEIVPQALRSRLGWKTKHDRTAAHEQAYAALGYTLANAPEREEIVMIDGEDGRQFLLGWRAIIGLGCRASARASIPWR
jgi:hypothetical protein